MKPLSVIEKFICFSLLSIFGIFPFAYLIAKQTGILKPDELLSAPASPAAEVAEQDLTNYMEHDAKGRLTKVFYKNGTVREYEYDANGNRFDRIVRPPK